LKRKITAGRVVPRALGGSAGLGRDGAWPLGPLRFEGVHLSAMHASSVLDDGRRRLAAVALVGATAGSTRLAKTSTLGATRAAQVGV